MGLYKLAALIAIFAVGVSAQSSGSFVSRGTGSASTLPLHVTTVQISSAQILAITATPVQLIAAQGAGKVIAVFMVATSYTPGAIAYTADPAADLFIDYASGAILIGPYFPLLLDGRLQNLVAAASVVAGNGFSSTTFVNAPLYLKGFSPGVPFTLGDGTVTVTVFYSVISAAGAA